MFEDRTKNYDFNKIDSAVRTKVLTENKQKEESMTEAQKKLFSEKKIEPSKPILNPHKSIDNLSPNSKYLQSFGKDITVGEAEELTEVSDKNEKTEEMPVVEQNNVNFDELIKEADEVKVDEKLVSKELKKISSAPKKNYSFRIKLVTGVYCILVALFGGWVISNSVNISNTNSNIYQTVIEKEQVDANIKDIVLKIKNFDDASKNPEDDSTIKKMITETIETTPEAIIEPNEYKVESNWFDVFCNWVSRLFGG